MAEARNGPLYLVVRMRRLVPSNVYEFFGGDRACKGKSDLEIRQIIWAAENRIGDAYSNDGTCEALHKARLRASRLARNRARKQAQINVPPATA